MIRPPGWAGVVFTEAGDGDSRGDADARRFIATSLGISEEWATIRQVHGNRAVEATAPGEAGEADAIWTRVPGLVLAVFTADCFGVVLEGNGAVGVAHAGWKGLEAGVVSVLASVMTVSGHPPRRAAVGPGIRPCCYEIGDDVATRLHPRLGVTSWGTTSGDLPAMISDQLPGLPISWAGQCTMHDAGYFSHRRDGTSARLATLCWA